MDTYTLPAPLRPLREIVAEYEEKASRIPEALGQFKRAETAVQAAANIGGAWGGTVFARAPVLNETDMRLALLRSAWRHVYDGLNIEAVASAKDRKQIELRLTNPLPFTLENIAEVFGAFLLDPRFHILKGLAEVFCDLDPAYKSHSKVKIGIEGLPKRVIVPGAASWGIWGRERVKDVFNALRAYRGQPRYDNRAFENIMDHAKAHGLAPFCGGEVKLFKNGNAHVIFDRPALLDINRALAEFYGDVLPDAPSEAEARRPSTEVARDLQFYRTPPAVAKTVVDALSPRSGETILEPSCGDGALMDELQARDLSLAVTGIEYDHARARKASAKGHCVMVGNFLEVDPDPRFDRVVMNPPFYGRHYKKHLDHALRFLKPGGVLVAILPASARYDHDNAPGEWRDLPPASFASSGTNIPTGYCIVRKPACDRQL